MKFTGQRLDEGTGLYFYGARYYDPVIGRFISPDTIVPYPDNPQCFNRYSYCLNNPLRYVDPTGHILGDSEGNDIEDLDQLVWAAGMLAAYGYTVDINLGDYLTDEYWFVNDLRILEKKGEIEAGTVDRYIEDEQEWIINPTEHEGFEIVEQPTIGLGGYWQFDVTCILGVGFKGGAIYDGNGWHWYGGVGIGFEIGGGASTSGDPLVSGYNTSASLSYGVQVQATFSEYEEDWHEWGNAWGGAIPVPLKLQVGGSVSTYYITK